MLSSSAYPYLFRPDGLLTPLARDPARPSPLRGGAALSSLAHRAISHD